MMRFLLALVIVIALVLLFVIGMNNKPANEKPVFLQVDTIANNHQTNISVKVRSLYKPDSFQIETLKKDYSAIWAHLNYLYNTNNVLAGKEYYTENWFRQINLHYNNPIQQQTKRFDEKHELYIENWEDDGLICTVTDSNIVLNYSYPDGTFRKTLATAAMVLLLQGDHWRIDAMRISKENKIQNLSDF